MLGQDRPEKNSANCLIRSGEFPSSRQASIDKTNDCATKSERGALVRGSDPPSGHSTVHKKAGDTWRASARRLIHIWAMLCRKQATKNLDLSSMAKYILRSIFFPGLGEGVGRRGENFS